MKISLLKQLIRMVEASEIEELEVSKWWTKVRITKSRARTGGAEPQRVVEAVLGDRVVAQKAVSEPAPADENLLEVKSPMVGTFYRAASPGAKPYASMGDTVEPGQIVGIIEAMKLMNEIESEVSGKIVKILVENEQPVEFGQTLFLVSPS
ncbi:acetyl-CoA carboxylase biotin carboxyl carrier protein [Candidatus Eisenbacteria bacterium]|uniref:Biotin carboxyl carrier protein of acetyl-CoA carboxylase n=1 Tax=Eiseniibacteriota bacterium TaxID=2212470 RepID=A0ABV6YQ59_UNCEI